MYLIDDDFILIIDLKNEGWFYKKVFEARGWVGFSCGSCIFIKDVNNIRWGRTIKHEVKHCHQQYMWGVFFPLIYIIDSFIIWFFIKEQHSYYDNCFEIQARKHADQDINIPRNQWSNGLNDRWSWW